MDRRVHERRVEPCSSDEVVPPVSLSSRPSWPAPSRPTPHSDGRLAPRPARRSAHRARPEPALQLPTVAWTGDAWSALAGEPIEAGCQLFVGNGEADVAGFDFASGLRQWLTPGGYVVTPSNATSALAFDDTAVVIAGRPGEPAVAQMWLALESLRVAVESYRVDEGLYPGGPDLGPVLVPTYISSMPWNPFAGRPMAYSPVPLAGDYFYEELRAGDGSGLAIWWHDGDYIAGSSSDCIPLPPGWPLSVAAGGTPGVFDPVDGSPGLAARRRSADGAAGAEPRRRRHRLGVG